MTTLKEMAYLASPTEEMGIRTVKMVPHHGRLLHAREPTSTSSPNGSLLHQQLLPTAPNFTATKMAEITYQAPQRLHL
jgi:hypothetical protein